MNTFKKIAAVTMAAVTLATTMIAASAASATIKFGAVTPTYDEDVRTVYAYDLSRYGDNTVSFSSVSKVLREGNVVFTVDFNKKADVLAGKNSRLTQEEKSLIPEYMASLRLDKPFIFYMGAGYDGATQYCLEVVDSDRRNCQTVIVGTPRLFDESFNIAGATATKLSSGGFYRLTIDYRIGDHHVLPEFSTVLGSEASNPYFYATKFHYVNYTKSTTGRIQMDIRPENIGKTLPLYANSVKVGYITISSNGKVTFTNC